MNSQPFLHDPPPAALVSEVAKVIVEAVNLRHWDESRLTAQTSLRTGGLELDSVDMLEVIVAIEHHFNLKVDDAATGERHFRTIGSIAQFIVEVREDQNTSASG